MLLKEPSDLHLLFHSTRKQTPFTTQSRHVHIWLKLFLLSLLEFRAQNFFLFHLLRPCAQSYCSILWTGDQILMLTQALWVEAFVFECNLLLFAGFFINWISLVPSSCPIHCWETGMTGLTKLQWRLPVCLWLTLTFAFQVTGEWKGKLAGGCPNYPSHCNNPIYRLQVKPSSATETAEVLLKLRGPK